MKRSHGPYSKHSRNLRSKGRVAITRFLQVFQPGDRVRVEVNPSVLEGRPSTLRFNHKTGSVLSQQGRRSYRVEVRDGGKAKVIVLSNAHLVKLYANPS